MGLTPGPLIRALFHCVLTNYVGSVSGLGSGIFVATVVDSKCDIFEFVVSVQIGVESKGG